MNRYFILYELEDERVVGGPDYLARLNAPTPWSQRIMPRLGNFARGGGRIAASAGTGQGGIVAPLRLDAAPSWDAAALVAELAGLDRIIAARVLLTDIAQTSIKTREKGMRANDGSFAALLLIEGLDEAAVRDALHHLRKTLPAEDHGAIDSLPLYRLAFSLPKQLCRADSGLSTTCAACRKPLSTMMGFTSTCHRYVRTVRGWAKERSDVPTITVLARFRRWARFALPTLHF